MEGPKLMEGYLAGIKVHVSHYGYHPDHNKAVVYNGEGVPGHFQIIREKCNTIVFSGNLKNYRSHPQRY